MARELLNLFLDHVPIHPFFLPAYALIIAIVVVSIVAWNLLPKPNLWWLLLLTLLFGVAGATIAYPVAMLLAKRATGWEYGWLFVSGPIGMALGQICALVVWWFKKPKAPHRTRSNNPTQSNARKDSARG